MPTYEEHYHDRHDELYGPTLRRVHGAGTGAAAGEDTMSAPVFPEPPPRTGSGSGRESWATYATSIGLTVGDDMGRDDIVALVDKEAKE